MDKQLAKMNYERHLLENSDGRKTSSFYLLPGPVDQSGGGSPTLDETDELDGFNDSSMVVDIDITAEPKLFVVSNEARIKKNVVKLARVRDPLRVSKGDLERLRNNFLALGWKNPIRQRRSSAPTNINGACCKLCEVYAANPSKAHNHIMNMHQLPRYYYDGNLLYRQKRKAMRDYKSTAEPADLLDQKKWLGLFSYAREVLRKECFPTMEGNWPATYKI